jgi:hypothetical protein
MEFAGEFVATGDGRYYSEDKPYYQDCDEC